MNLKKWMTTFLIVAGFFFFVLTANAQNKALNFGTIVVPIDSIGNVCIFLNGERIGDYSLGDFSAWYSFESEMGRFEYRVASGKWFLIAPKHSRIERGWKIAPPFTSNVFKVKKKIPSKGSKIFELKPIK